MLRYPSLLLLLTLLLQPFTSPSVSQELDQTKGKTLSRTYDFKEAGKPMKYSLYIPTSYDKQKKSPADCCPARVGQQCGRHHALPRLHPAR